MDDLLTRTAERLRGISEGLQDPADPYSHKLLWELHSALLKAKEASTVIAVEPKGCPGCGGTPIYCAKCVHI
jgi:hypothetical protein